MTDQLTMFKQQIEEDISLIQKDWAYAEPNLKQDDYAFDFWILSKLFSIDEEIVLESITDYSDKGIDCFASYDDSKELYIIQNKYYGEGSSVTRKEVADFLKSPLDILKNEGYSKKCATLQEAFNKAKNDEDYKIFLYFFTTYDKESDDIKTLIMEANNADYGLPCYIEAKYFCLSDIYDLYYGKNYKEDITFNHSLGTLSKATFASIREEYGIEDMYESYYIITPVVELYNLLIDAESRDYSIFAKNIRDYLGDNPVNNGIVETLRSKEDRKNFLYYNNGITMVCKKIEPSYIDSHSNLRMLPMTNPQIVNGCQTVNSIKKVLENIPIEEANTEYQNVYVMVKTLVIDNMDDPANQTFYNNVVKYTNKQNAISDKAFVANFDLFFRLQDEFRERGFLLSVRPSDKNSFKEISKKERGDLKESANATIEKLNIPATKYSDIQIDLEKLLQVYLAFIKGGYYAFTKKSQILKEDSDIFLECSSQIQNNLTIENMIKLYWLYYQADQDRKTSEDKKSPIPYYVIGFLGELIGEKTPENIQNKLGYIFENTEVYEETFRYLRLLSNSYKADYPLDYNDMIKKPIDEAIFSKALSLVNAAGDWPHVQEWIE